MPTVDVNDIRVSYRDHGTGPPLLLLHAFPLSSAMWEPQISALSTSHRVIAPDLRGFGKTHAPDDPASYSMAAFADDAAALLAHLDLGPVIVAGLSMGGYVAFELLRRHRNLLRAVVLADTRASADPPEGRARRSAQQELIRNGQLPAVLDTLIGGLLAADTATARPDVVGHVRSIMETAPASGVVGALEAMKARPDATGELAGIDLPTLVVVGSEDALSPPDVGREMARAIPGAAVVVIPGAGHLSNVEQPQAFNDALGAFLDLVEQRS